MNSTELKIDSKTFSVGKLFILASDKQIFYLSNSYAKTKQAANKFSSAPAITGSNNLIKKAFTQIQQYLQGNRKDFNLPLHLAGTAFQLKSWKALYKIQHGEIRTYKQLADSIGHPKAARAFGSAIGKNPLPILIPCHRVVAQNSLGGFSLGLSLKKKLLQTELMVKTPKDG